MEYHALTTRRTGTWPFFAHDMISAMRPSVSSYGRRLCEFVASTKNAFLQHKLILRLSLLAAGDMYVHVCVLKLLVRTAKVSANIGHARTSKRPRYSPSLPCTTTQLVLLSSNAYLREISESVG